MMKLSFLSFVLIPLTTVISVQAHTRVFGVWINGVWQGDGRGVYIRSPPNDDPVKDIHSDAMACNVNNSPVPKTLPVKAGDKLTFEWYLDNRGDNIVDPSHKGPVVVYIAPTSTKGSGKVWVKLWEEGFKGEWAVDKLISARGQHSIIIPEIAAGDYLLRAEILTLHESETAYTDNPNLGIQLYMACAQIRVTSSGSNLPKGVAFPGAYDYSNPGIVFNLYEKGSGSKYKIPGPPVWSGAAPGGSIGQAGNRSNNKPADRNSTPATSEDDTKQAAWEQCGGKGYSGPTSCVSGYKCQYMDKHYSQCVSHKRVSRRSAFGGRKRH